MISRLRDLGRVVSCYGTELEMVTLMTAVPSDTVALLRYADEARKELRDLRLALPDGCPVMFDPVALAAELGREAERLRGALDEIMAAAGDVARWQGVKDQAKAAFEADSQRGLRLLAALAEYAGESGIARRVEARVARSG